MTIGRPIGTWDLFRLDPQLLDDQPPFLGVGLHERAERLWRLPLARKNLQPQSGKARSNCRIGQRFYGRRIKLADDVLRRAPGREKPVPEGVGERWPSHLAEGRDVRYCGPPSVACHRIGLY